MEFISSWVQGIIVAVSIATVLEMILPNGNSKKYIKIVIGIFIVYNIISPVINKISGKEVSLDEVIDLEKYIQTASAYEFNTSKLENNNNSNIKEVYILNLKKDMKAKIEDKGYFVNSIQINIKDDEEYTINDVNLTIHKKEENKEKNEGKENKESRENKENIENINENEINNESNISTIEKVNIQIETGNYSYHEKKDTAIINIRSNDINQIKDYINSTYDISKDKIKINE